MEHLIQIILSPLALFTQLWDSLYAESISGRIAIVGDGLICLVGSVMAVVVIPLIPVNVFPLGAYAQRIAIGLVGIALFGVFIGHAFGEYEQIRLVEFLIHTSATISLFTGAWLRSNVEHREKAAIQRRFRND